jgi:membrane-bound lytic murein transglycosylase D
MKRAAFILSSSLSILAWVALAVPFAQASSQLESSAGLVRYPELEPNVEFWRKVFSEYTRRQLVFHDPYRMDIVWTVHDISDIVDSKQTDTAKARAIQSRIASETKRLSDLVRRVGAATPRNGEERRIADVLAAAGKAAPSAKVLAGRIRAQRGLGDELCESVDRARPLLPEFRRILREQRVPEELAALPLVESGYRIGAHSHKGAVGMWQFTRGTGRRFLHIDHVVDERRDPLQATEAAAKYLRENFDRLGSWPLAITAYNHGANGMAYAVRKLQTKNLATIVDKYNSRYFGFASRNFYSEFLAASDVLEKALRECPAAAEPTPVPAQVVIDSYVPLASLAAAAGIDSDDLMVLNPALMPDVGSGRLRVPSGYRLNVPASAQSAFHAAYAKLPAAARYTAQADYYARHRVARGETLSEIASAYKTTVAALQSHNDIRDPRRLRSGVILKVPVASAAAVGRAALPTSHRVASGETLSHVAKRYGVTVASLARYNNIADADALRQGQVIRIPAPGAASAPAVSRYRTHTVAPGQTLSHIAKIYRTTVRALQIQNGIKDPRRLQGGQTIKVPL